MPKNIFQKEKCSFRRSLLLYSCAHNRLPFLQHWGFVKSHIVSKLDSLAWVPLSHAQKVLARGFALVQKVVFGRRLPFYMCAHNCIGGWVCAHIFEKNLLWKDSLLCTCAMTSMHLSMWLGNTPLLSWCRFLFSSLIFLSSRCCALK